MGRQVIKVINVGNSKHTSRPGAEPLPSATERKCAGKAVEEQHPHSPNVREGVHLWDAFYAAACSIGSVLAYGLGRNQ